jgi:hypothetical protein
VRACMAQHQMSRARTIVRTVVPSRSAQPPEMAAEGEPRDEITIFERCDWPPPAWADPDGYSEIAVVATSGPIPYEASDASRADLIKSNCSVLRVRYSYVGMGNQRSEPPITSKPDNVIYWFDGRRWRGEELPFLYERDELVVLRNTKARLDDVRCVK